tara:strand:+ start:483 stop:665 length:183 start_codon:yes stop_codon:yes gene_type:complete
MTTKEYLENPPKEDIRGKCPDCGSTMIANLYYIQEKGHLLMYECVDALKKPPTCEYRKVL